MSPPIQKRKGIKVDFHVHSHFSPDGDMPPEEIIRSAKMAGIDAIAVTDHNTLEGGIQTEKIAKGILVFVGSEIKTKHGEIIGLNLKENVKQGLSPVKTCKLIKEQNGFVIVPHPFDRMRKGIGKDIEKIVRYIDAVEVFNARTLFHSFNKKAFEFAEKNRLPGVAGSDSHFSKEIGSAYTIVKSEIEKDKILKAVKDGKVSISGEKTGIHPHWKTFVTKMGKKL